MNRILLSCVVIFGVAGFTTGCVGGGVSLGQIELSSNSELGAISISAGTLVPPFSTSETTYTASVPYSASTFTLSGSLSSPKATLQINGGTPVSGAFNVPVALTVGTNTITAVVRAEDGSEKTYTFTVTRAAISTDASLTSLTLSSGSLSPSFSSGVTAYAVSISDIPQNFTVTPTASSPLASIESRLNGGAYTLVSSGTASAVYTPNTGANTVDVKVTAESGSVMTYALSITYGVCGAGFYSDGVNSCVPVTPGYWSPANDNTRTACSNKPANSRYTSPTASSANCPWSCVDGYLTTDGVACVVSPTARTLACNDNEIAVGLWGRSGSIIDRLGVRCAILNEDGSLGTARTGPSYGGNGGGPFNDTGAFDCPTGSALYEVDGTLSIYPFPGGANRTGRIRFRCKDLSNATISDWRPDGIAPNPAYWGTTTLRSPFNFQCGSGANPYGDYLNGIIIDDASGAAYTGDALGITCR